MKSLFIKLVVPVMLIAGGPIACTSGFGPQGGLFTSTTLGVYGTKASAPKSGSACSASYLGLVAVGDGSVEEAAANGQISEVTAIDLESFSVLFVYARLCTVVRGQ